jgi:hypothetical protein
LDRLAPVLGSGFEEGCEDCTGHVAEFAEARGVDLAVEIRHRLDSQEERELLSERAKDAGRGHGRFAGHVGGQRRVVRGSKARGGVEAGELRIEVNHGDKGSGPESRAAGGVLRGGFDCGDGAFEKGRIRGENDVAQRLDDGGAEEASAIVLRAVVGAVLADECIASPGHRVARQHVENGCEDLRAGLSFEKLGSERGVGGRVWPQGAQAIETAADLGSVRTRRHGAMVARNRHCG